jgi:hypothetical protein
MNTLHLLSLSAAFFLQGQAVRSPVAPAGGSSDLSAIGPWVRLQQSYPGAPQAGNAHLAGTFRATGGSLDGVDGFSNDLYTAGVYGENMPGNGVVGRSNFVGVWGDNVGGGYGVYGASVWPGGTGMLGRGGMTGVRGESGGSFGNFGVYGSAYQAVTGQGTYGLVSFGTAYVSGDLVVTGSKTGYVVDLIRNGDSVPLAPGELVEIVGSEPAVLGDIPVAIVQRARAANARAVLGPISNALALGPELVTPPEHLAPVEGETLRLSNAARPASTPSVLRVEGAILPGGYGNVVTLGAFRALKVDARFGAIRAGDLLVASAEPGFAMSDPDPRVGTVIGKALASWSHGQGEIPVMVGMR